MGLVFADFQRTHSRRRRRWQQQQRERRTYKPSPFGQSQINFKRTNRANTTTTTTTLRKKSRKTNTRQKQQKKRRREPPTATATERQSSAAQRSRASADCDKCVYDRKGVLTNQSSSFAHSLGPGPHFVQRESAPALFHSNSPQYTNTHSTQALPAHAHSDSGALAAHNSPELNCVLYSHRTRTAGNL